MSAMNVLALISKVLLGTAFIALYVFVQWKYWNNRYKGLGTGGIQTVFGDKKNKQRR
jgi:hypothetical protein